MSRDEELDEELIVSLAPSRLSWTHPEILAATVPLDAPVSLLLQRGPVGVLERAAYRLELANVASVKALYLALAAETPEGDPQAADDARIAVRGHLRERGLVSPERGAIREWTDRPSRTAAEIAAVLRHVAANITNGETR